MTGRYGEYLPLDEALARPLTRALRRLRHFDWCDQTTLLIACEVSTDETERNTFWAAVGRAVRDGLIERRRERSIYDSQRNVETEYRITATGRRAADAPVRRYAERMERA